MQINPDTIRAALEGAIKPLVWNRGAAHCDVLSCDFYAPQKKGKQKMQEKRTARILSAIDIDALAKALGSGERKAD